MAVNLRYEQIEAIRRMRDGCILCGGVGTGKSRTALAYYFLSEGGKIGGNGSYLKMYTVPINLYIITTAQKRDKLEWNEELINFLMKENCDDDIINGKTSPWGNLIFIDSWNNISRYKYIENAFFIFDEQRVIGNGVWAKTFINIAKHNRWILLSATPGDKWEDYIPVFIANGFYKNRSEFLKEHAVFSRFSKYPKIEKYLNIGRLIRLRDRILVDIPVKKTAECHHETIMVDYDRIAVKELIRTRWNCYENKPIENAAMFSYVFRRLVNSHPSRILKVLELVESKGKAIIFYNYDYELDILKNTCYGKGVEIAEWNGHKHQEIPETNRWVYLVQYTAGCEGWNCIKTDTIIFYSQNYSYRVMTQAAGRIDRLNTPYDDLYFYHLKTTSKIDLAIDRALKSKKKFNEGKFYNGYFQNN